MTLYTPGPYEVRLNYSTTVSSVLLQHVQHLSLALIAAPDPGDAFTDIDCDFRGTPPADITLKKAVDDWVVQMKAIYSSGGGNSIDSAELWHYDPDTFDASFVSSYTVGVSGTSGSSVVAAGQSIVTMRTQLGGIFKLSFMESVIASAVTDTGTISNANLESLVAAIEAGTYPWIGRDNSYPFSRIAHYPQVNKALFKKRFRP